MLAALGIRITLFKTLGSVDDATAERAAGDRESEPSTIAGAAADAITVSAAGVTDTPPPPTSGFNAKVIMAQSVAPERSPVAPSCTLPAVGVLSTLVEVVMRSPPLPAETLI